MLEFVLPRSTEISGYQAFKSYPTKTPGVYSEPLARSACSLQITGVLALGPMLNASLCFAEGDEQEYCKHQHKNET